MHRVSRSIQLDSGQLHLASAYITDFKVCLANEAILVKWIGLRYQRESYVTMQPSALVQRLGIWTLAVLLCHFRSVCGGSDSLLYSPEDNA